MAGRPHKNELHQYPYRIPDPPKLNEETVRALKSRRDHVCEFLRVEALPRSSRVWALFSARRDGQPDALRERYGVGDGWEVLIGAQHRYLDARTPLADPRLHGTWVVERMVLDFRAFLEREPEAAAEALRSLLLDRYHLLWMIDPSYPPEAVIKAIRPYLQSAHKAAPSRIPLPRRVKHVAKDGMMRDPLGSILVSKAVFATWAVYSFATRKTAQSPLGSISNLLNTSFFCCVGASASSLAL